MPFGLWGGPLCPASGVISAAYTATLFRHAVSPSRVLVVSCGHASGSARFRPRWG